MNTVSISEDLVKMIIDVGQVSDIIMMRDFKKFGPNDSFKDSLSRILDNLIQDLARVTKFYEISYVEVDEVDDNSMDIEICLHRLYHYTTKVVDILVNNAADIKTKERSIACVVFYIKLICSIYSINADKIVLDKNDFENTSIA